MGLEPRSMLITVLVLGASTLLAGPSAGAGVGMDWDLSQAHASFLPGNGDHTFGYRLAFAGDVNGDGLDDILISACYSDGEVGFRSGRTYLFLGRTDGWSTNMTASEADASFYGEEINDKSGYSVAGVGDLDGDGLDDFVISSPSSQNPQAGDRRGRAYLFYGNASGWSLDTNLSSADQTFNGGFVAAAGDVNADGYDDLVIGKEQYSTYSGTTTIYFGSPDRNIGMGASFSGEEYYEDYSGLCVAGAGDVNGDGYDDILVGSRNREGGVGAGKTYLVLGRGSGWPYSLRTADASFVGSAHDASGTALAGVGDVDGDGFDDFLINAYNNGSHAPGAGTTYLFLGRAEGWATNTSLGSADASFHGEAPYDLSGMSVATAGDVDADGYDDFLVGSPDNDEAGKSAGKVHLVLGRPDGWSLDTNISDAADAEFLGEYPEGRAGVWVAGGGDANGDGTDDVLIGAYNVYGDDLEFNKAYLVLLDYAPPALTDNTPPTATTGDWLTVSVRATDLTGVKAIGLDYWPTDHSHFHGPMTLSSGDARDGTWTFEVPVPSSSLGPLNYSFTAIDALGHSIQTANRSVAIIDDDAPALEPGDAPPYVTTGQTVTLEVNVSDNINVSGVWVAYHYAWAYTESYNLSMTPITVDAAGNGLYAVDNLTVGIHMSADLVYYFKAVDTSGNWNHTNYTYVTILDDDPPWLEADLSDAVARTGSPFELVVNVTDNIKISEVYVEYWFGDHDDCLVLARMARVNGVPIPYKTYGLSIVIPLNSTEPLRYGFSFSDTSGNWNGSDVVTVEVVDDVAPVPRAGDDVVAGMHEDVRLDGTGSADNIGIANFTWTLGDLVLEGPTATHAFPVPGAYELTLTVEDAAGNAATDAVVVTVLDTEPPVADAGGDIEVYQGTTVTFDGSGSTDNVAVVEHRWYVAYTGHGSDPVLTGPHPGFVFRLAGEFVVTLLVTDAAGNNATDTVTVTVKDNEPPVAVAGGDVTATVGDNVTLNASNSSDNVAIVNWTWTVEREGARSTLEGEVVVLALDAPGVYTVRLVVTDARGNSAEDGLTVTAEEAPAPPPDGPDGDGGGGPSVYLLAGIVVIILAVALVIVMMMRRRAGG